MSGVVETDAEVWIIGVVETDAEVWITGVVETDAEVWITGVVETDPEVWITGVVETVAEVWITGVVETDAEVWISGVVTTGGRVHWLLSLPFPCSVSLLITELLALLFPSVLHTLGLKKSLMDVLPKRLFQFILISFASIFILKKLSTYHKTTIFLSVTEDVCVLSSDWTRIRKHRGHVSTNRKIPYS